MRAIPLFYLALWKPQESHQLIAFLILSALLNSLLKDFFDDPRPDLAFALDGRVGGSYGFPSGHAQLAVVTWGALAIFAGTRAAALGATVMIIGICFSRLYLGVHDIEDVAGGLTLGGPQPTALRALPGGAHQAVEKPLLASPSGGPAPRSSGFAPRWFGLSRTALGPFLG